MLTKQAYRPSQLSHEKKRSTISRQQHDCSSYCGASGLKFKLLPTPVAKTDAQQGLSLHILCLLNTYNSLSAANAFTPP